MAQKQNKKPNLNKANQAQTQSSEQVGKPRGKQGGQLPAAQSGNHGGGQGSNEGAGQGGGGQRADRRDMGQSQQERRDIGPTDQQGSLSEQGKRSPKRSDQRDNPTQAERKDTRKAGRADKNDSEENE